MSEGGNSPEVVEMLEKAVELNKTDVYSWESLAKVYVQVRTWKCLVDGS